MQLDGYLNRIGYHGTRTVCRETLFTLHRAHVRTIPYENLDIALGRTLSLDEAAIYAKLVTARRGGWCYEMNGLFAWALEELGFTVTRLASTVGRKSPDTDDGAHLLLLVELDRSYLADVGFGNGMLEPIPLEVGTYHQHFRTYHLAQEGDRWFLTKQADHPYAGPGIDFTLRPHRLSDFADYCKYLQTFPESPFVRTTICHRLTPEGIVSLIGAVPRTIRENSFTEQLIENRAAYQQALGEQFCLWLSDADVSSLWQRTWERHLARIATSPTK